MSDTKPEREFAITFTYIVRATDAADAMTKIGDPDDDDFVGADRITIMPNLGV